LRRAAAFVRHGVVNRSIRTYASWLLLPLAVAACAPAAANDPAVAPQPAATAPAATPPDPVEHVKNVEVSDAIKALIDAEGRTEADRALDAGRHPGETLAFFGVTEGMKVAELGAGTGYTAELLARAVGPTGTVYGHNTKLLLDRFAEAPWSARLARPVMKNVARVDRDFDDPLPPEANGLDAVFLVLFYHDTVWLEVDRPKMNRAIYAALKPGGVFAVVDHSAREGAGVADVKTLHRIEERVVREEIEQAGFQLVADASFLRNPSDERDWNDAPSVSADKRGTSDRFVLKFVKPSGK